MRRPAGFSLVELVIAMAILGLGLVGAMRIFPVGLRASQRAQFRSRAALIAQRMLESLKLKPWEQLEEEETSQEEDGFTVVTKITRPTLEHLTDTSAVKALEVDVQWNEEGKSRTLTLATYVYHAQS